MMRDGVDPTHFTIPFTFTGASHANHRPLAHAIRDALELDPSLDSACSFFEEVGPAPLEADRCYQARLRVNCIYKPKTIPGRPQRETIAYSYLVFDDAGDVIAWSCDLDTNYTVSKGGYVSFHVNHVEIEMTDALRAAIKALVPKKPRAKKTP
jgi:hypothetical protein